jgi:hypothetical protein
METISYSQRINAIFKPLNMRYIALFALKSKINGNILHLYAKNKYICLITIT